MNRQVLAATSMPAGFESASVHELRSMLIESRDHIIGLEVQQATAFAEMIDSQVLRDEYHGQAQHLAGTLVDLQAHVASQQQQIVAQQATIDNLEQQLADAMGHLENRKRPLIVRAIRKAGRRLQRL